MPCSSTPARTRASTYSRLRASRTTDSMPCAVEQVGQQQPGRTGAHDPDLGLHHPSASVSAITRWATAKAVLAAGTPA